MWDWILQWGTWIVSVCLVIVGLIGTIVPFLPGHLFILAGALVPFFAFDDSGGIDIRGLIAMGVGMVVAQAFEFFSGAMGSRWFGGTKWGAVGAFVGGIAGIFFMPLGLVLGPLIGAFVGEYGLANQEVRPATKSGVGSVVGTLTGMVVNIVVGVAMVIVMVLDILVW